MCCSWMAAHYKPGDLVATAAFRAFAVKKSECIFGVSYFVRFKREKAAAFFFTFFALIPDFVLA